MGTQRGGQIVRLPGIKGCARQSGDEIRRLEHGRGARDTPRSTGWRAKSRNGIQEAARLRAIAGFGGWCRIRLSSLVTGHIGMIR